MGESWLSEMYRIIYGLVRIRIFVTREAIWQRFSRVTKSQVKIIAVSLFRNGQNPCLTFSMIKREVYRYIKVTWNLLPWHEYTCECRLITIVRWPLNLLDSSPYDALISKLNDYRTKKSKHDRSSHVQKLNWGCSIRLHYLRSHFRGVWREYSNVQIKPMERVHTSILEHGT